MILFSLKCSIIGAFMLFTENSQPRLVYEKWRGVWTSLAAKVNSSGTEAWSVTENRNAGEQIITKEAAALEKMVWIRADCFDISRTIRSSCSWVADACLIICNMGTFADTWASEGASSDTANCFGTHWEHRIITATELAATVPGFSICLWKNLSKFGPAKHSLP